MGKWFVPLHVCVMSNVIVRSHDRKELGCVFGCSIQVGCVLTRATLAMGRITDFDMARSNDTANSQQIQHGVLLFVMRSVKR